MGVPRVHFYLKFRKPNVHRREERGSKAELGGRSTAKACEKNTEGQRKTLIQVGLMWSESVLLDLEGKEGFSNSQESLQEGICVLLTPVPTQSHQLLLPCQRYYQVCSCPGSHAPHFIKGWSYWWPDIVSLVNQKQPHHWYYFSKASLVYQLSSVT